MVDPGSVIGIVSLGLQVAQGLGEYYSYFKAYAEDISQAVNRIERLQRVLAILDIPLRKLEMRGDRVTELVRTSMCNCAHELKKLDEVVEKCAKVPIGETMAVRMKMVKKRLSYPFRKCTLSDVCAWVDRAQTHLDIALQALHLTVSVEFREKAVADLASCNRQLAIVQQLQDDTTHTIKSHNDIAYTRLQQDSAIGAHIDKNVEECLKQQQQIAQQIHALINITKTALNQTSLAQMLPSDATLVTQTSQTVANASSPTAPIRLQSFHNHRVGHKVTRCICPDVSPTKDRDISWGRMSLLWQSRSAHSAPCVMSYTTTKTDSVSARYRHNQLMSAYIFEVTVNYTRSVCKFSVSGGLQVHRVATRDNPAWRLVLEESQKQWRGAHDGSVSSPLGNIKHGIDRCFREGSATPTDVFESGETLLIRICDWMPYFLDAANSTSAECALELLKFLVDAGAPIDNANFATAGRPSPLEILMCWGIPEISKRHRNVAHLCSYMAEQGFTWSTEALLLDEPCFEHSSAQELLTLNTIVEGFDGNPVEGTIWRKSAQDLRHMISKATSLGQSESSRDWNLEVAKYLTTSSDWPDGLRIILSYTKDDPESLRLDLGHHNPLRAAYGFENWESVQVLLDFGFKIDSKLFEWSLGRSSSAAMHHMLRVICRSPIVTEECLLNRSFSVQQLIQSGRVFNIAMNPEAADAIYNAGFQTIDDEFHSKASGKPWQGVTTPLWTHAEFVVLTTRTHHSEPILGISALERARWFFEKQVRRNWLHPRLGTTPVHLLAASPIMFDLRYKSNRKRGITDSEKFSKHHLDSSSWWNFHVQIAKAAGKDLCCCACSKEGCLPITCTLKVSFYTEDLKYRWSSNTDATSGVYQQMQDETVNKILSWMDSLLSTSLDMANAALRVLTFEKLGIRHTCHELFFSSSWRYRYDQSSSSEVLLHPVQNIHEIHDEDAELIEKLADLTAEFESAYSASKIPSFYAFYKGYWTMRMDGVLVEMDIVTEEYVRAVQNVGVILEPFGPELPPIYESGTEVG